MRDETYQFLNRYLSVSRETFDKLFIYHDLLIKWQKQINLVSDNTLSDSWNRHFLDSAQLLSHIPNPLVKTADIGSGAGFPGMVLAIMGMSNIHLIESDAKKIVFLKEVSRLTNTSVMIHHSRIEDLSIGTFDLIVSRALSDLNKLLQFSSHFVSHETFCLFHKGKNYSKEIEEAKKSWSFDHAIFPSVSDPHGVIIKLSNLKRPAP